MNDMNNLQLSLFRGVHDTQPRPVTLMELIGMYVNSRLSAKKIALSMNRLGFEQRRTRVAREWLVVTLTGDDIKAAQRMNAHQSHKE